MHESTAQEDRTRVEISVECLREMLDTEICRFDRESTQHKTIYRRSEFVVVLTTAMTTVTAGLGLVIPGGERQTQFAVLVLSALTTAATSWAASRRAKDLWQHEREVYYALIDIRRELKFRHAATTLQPAEVMDIFLRVTAVLGSSTAKWLRILERDRPKPSGTAANAT